MLIHTVFFWLKSDVKDTVTDEFKADLDALCELPGIAKFHIGTPAATEQRPVTDHSWDFSIHQEFETMADHDAYQVDPDHLAFIAKCKDWWEKVAVYDTQA